MYLVGRHNSTQSIVFLLAFLGLNLQPPQWSHGPPHTFLYTLFLFKPAELVVLLKTLNPALSYLYLYFLNFLFWEPPFRAPQGWAEEWLHEGRGQFALRTRLSFPFHSLDQANEVQDGLQPTLKKGLRLTSPNFMAKRPAELMDLQAMSLFSSCISLWSRIWLIFAPGQWMVWGLFRWQGPHCLHKIP